MVESIEEKINLLIDNSEILDSVNGIGFGTNIFKKCNALNLTIKNKRADKERIEEAIRIIKKNTSLFSNFRGNNLLTTAVNIAQEPDMEGALEEIMDIYKRLKEEFFNNEYLILAAQIIYSARERTKISEAIINTRSAYDYMKKSHRFLTGNEDICSAAVIATTSSNLEKTFKDVEECYNTLNKLGFSKGNYLQGLCNMLAVINLPVKERCDKVHKMRESLNNNKINLKGYAFTILGVIPFVCDDYDDFGEEASIVAEKIRNAKGFGNFSLGKYLRNMIAVSLLASQCSEELGEKLKENIENLTNNASLSIVIAMQVAAASAAAASAAAAASSSSGS
ncbi:DUF4003 family protein [Clostridium perfringens]|nr:DUF4003 family protein [Clostridium perfringens]